MKEWTIKPATTSQLAELYGWSYRVFSNQIKPLEQYIGKRIGYFYTIKQILIIFEHLGIPPYVQLIS